jgi:hypothetical protein
VPGQFSEYQVFEMAYTYARIELSIDGDRYVIQPIDFIGETLLEGGRYTYELDADLQGQFDSLTLRFIED